jgi:hypothetical protein
VSTHMMMRDRGLHSPSVPHNIKYENGLISVYLVILLHKNTVLSAYSTGTVYCFDDKHYLRRIEKTNFVEQFNSLTN